jgi:phenylpyruvate tautomerase PptA (4-oxalocrotonate tautomerase family)
LKQFVVFMCPKCSNFTNSPVGQKRRRCSYCGTIIDISKANRALYDSPEQAQAAVKLFNAERGGDEFRKAVEQSRMRLRSFLPDKPVDIEKITSDDEQVVLPGKRARLMAILDSEAKAKPCTLDRLEEVCKNGGLSWTWVEKTIQSLSNAGTLIFPRPWEVQLVEGHDDTSKKSHTVQDVSEEIVSYLRKRKERVRVVDIVQYFQERGISEDSVDDSLERLMRSGDIFQPAVGYVSLV